MKKQTILLITSNQYKFNEVKSFFKNTPFSIKASKLKLTEVQSFSQKIIVTNKAKQARSLTDKPFIVDDTGLFVEKFHQFPGTYTKQILQGIGLKRFLNLINHREPAHYQTTIAYFTGKQIQLFTGKIPGHLIKKVNLDNVGASSSFSDIFVPEGQTQTLRQLTLGKFPSHRINALSKLKKYLSKKYVFN